MIGRTSHGALWCAAALLAAPAAVAAPAATTPAHSPSEASATRLAAIAEADRLIAEAEAEGQFVNITQGEVPTVRHPASGLVCTFGNDYAGNQIILFDNPTVVEQDVGCATNGTAARISLYATLYRRPKSAEAALRDSIAEVKGVYPDLRPYEGEQIDVEVEGVTLPQIYITHFQMSWNGRSMYSSTQTAQHRGWIFKMRTTGPLDDAQLVQTEARAGFIRLLIALQGDPGAEEDGPN